MRALLLFLAAASLAGCWNDRETIHSVAWSDDGEQQLYIKLFYEESGMRGPYGMGHRTRNHAYEVWSQAPQGGEGTLLFERTSGLPGATAYYMREAGYVLLDQPEDHGYRWERLDLSQGDRHTVARSAGQGSGPVSPCRSTEVLPAPDGALLALMERVPPQGDGCEGGTFLVDLVDAADLAVVHHYELAMNGMPGTQWTRDGSLRIWNWQGQAWRIVPGEPVADDTPPVCQFPRTSSSDLSEDGLRIGPGTVDHPVDVVESGADTCWWD